MLMMSYISKPQVRNWNGNSLFSFIGTDYRRFPVQIPFLFGFSASFNDSIVYFTDIQKVDNVLLEKKTNFLLSRDQYSYQLRDFLANQKGQPNRTCITMFATSRKNAEKEYLNLQKLYTAKAKGKYDVRMLATDFVYVRVEEDE